MIAFGAPQEVIDELPKPPDTFEVFPENWEVLNLFLKVSTQWRTAGTMSKVVFIGLDYQAVSFLFTISRTKNRAAVLADLQVMEVAARIALNGG